MPFKNQAAIDRKLMIDEFNDMYSKESTENLKLGFPPDVPVKSFELYTDDDKFKYIGVLHTVKYLQAMRQANTQNDDEWFLMVDDQVKRKNISKKLGEIIKTSSRIRRTKADYYAENLPVYEFKSRARRR